MTALETLEQEAYIILNNSRTQMKKSKKDTDQVFQDKREEAEVASRTQQAPEVREPKDKERTSRQIVGFGTIPSIKNLILDDGTDEIAAVEKMINKCLNDFAVKCATIISSCAEMPSSPYTYIMFIERFGWIQQEDATSREGTKSIVISTDQSCTIEKKVVEAYQVMNASYYITKKDAELAETLTTSMWHSYANVDLLEHTNDKSKAISLVKDMFGKGHFPDLVLWYNFNDDDNEWQYTYSIAPAQGEDKKG